MATATHIHLPHHHAKRLGFNQAENSLGVVSANIPSGIGNAMSDAALMYNAAPGIARTVEHAAPATAAATGAAVATAAEGISAFDVGLNAGMNAANMAGMVGFVPIAGGVAAGGLGLVGAKKASKGLSGFIGKLSNGTLAEIGEATHTRGFFSAITKPIANVAGSVIGPISDATGLSKWRAGANDRTAKKYLGKMHGVAETLHNEHLASAPTELLASLREMHSTAMSAHTNGYVDAAHYERFNNAKSAFTQANEALKEAGASSKLKKAVDQMEHHLGNAHDHHGFSQGWRNVKESVQNAPKTFGKASALHGLVNFSFIALPVGAAISDARAFARNIKPLKQMYADMTGQDAANVSTFQALFSGNAPASVREARSNMFKHLAVSEATNAVSIAVNVKGARSRHWGMASSTIAYMAPQFIGDGIQGFIGESTLQKYATLKQAYAAKQPIPPEYYAEFACAASAELAKRGGPGSVFAQAIGAQYAAENMDPAKILLEADNGKMIERVHAVIAQNEAALKTGGAASSPASSHAAQSVSSAISHTARLKGAQSQHQVIGDHTKAVVDSNNGMEPGLA